MFENEKKPNIKAIELMSIIAEKYFESEATEPKINLDIKISRGRNDVNLLFCTLFEFVFRVEIKLRATYNKDDFQDLDNSTIIDSITPNCYPIYSKLITNICLVMEQLDLTPFIMDYNLFIKSLENLKETTTSK